MKVFQPRNTYGRLRRLRPHDPDAPGGELTAPGVAYGVDGSISAGATHGHARPARASGL